MTLGQSSLEFLSMVSMSAILLAGLYGFTTAKQVEISEYTRTENARSVMDRVAFEVEMALVQGEGYSRVFSLPQRVSGERYNVSVGHSKTVVRTGSDRFVSSTLYDGDFANMSTEKSNVVRVVNNGSIHLVEVE